jgi:hypothetical protein
MARKKKRRRARSAALGGHARTCIQFQCVRGHGSRREGDCKPGYVLRCAEFAAVPGLPRTANTRKAYQEFTYGQGPRYRGARGRYAPKLPTAYLDPIQKWARGLPTEAVRKGAGKRKKRG